jgi:hypothetical protein
MAMETSPQLLLGIKVDFLWKKWTTKDTKDTKVEIESDFRFFLLGNRSKNMSHYQLSITLHFLHFIIILSFFKKKLHKNVTKILDSPLDKLRVFWDNLLL